MRACVRACVYQVLLQGPLDKRGGFNTAWRRRRFELRADGALSYYKSAPACTGREVRLGRQTDRERQR
jgi:hypothetical protein